MPRRWDRPRERGCGMSERVEIRDSIRARLCWPMPRGVLAGDALAIIPPLADLVRRYYLTMSPTEMAAADAVAVVVPTGWTVHGAPVQAAWPGIAAFAGVRIDPKKIFDRMHGQRACAGVCGSLLGVDIACWLLRLVPAAAQEAAAALWADPAFLDLPGPRKRARQARCKRDYCRHAGQRLAAMGAELERGLPPRLPNGPALAAWGPDRGAG